MSYTYTYQLTTPFDTSILEVNISSDSIIVETLVSLSFDGDSEILTLNFDGALTATEETEIINLVNNNVSDPVNYYQQVAIGYNAGELNPLIAGGIAIGNLAGQISQQNSIAIGFEAGQNMQSSNSIAIGNNAAQIMQGQNAVALGYQAGLYFQNSGGFGLGFQAAYNHQGSNALALGSNAGQHWQSSGAVAIGYEVGMTGQSQNSVGIGAFAASTSQGLNSVAIGATAGYFMQGNYAVAIGGNAGQNAQGSNAIAIGYNAGVNSQYSQSIVLNASGSTLDATDSGLFVAPLSVIDTTTPQSGSLFYNTTTSEIQYTTTAKTFVIDHPIDPTKYLVHACVESDNSDVYYRGSASITNNIFAIVQLPKYAVIASNYTIHITPKYNSNSNNGNISYKVSDVVNNTFTVYGCSGAFNWMAIGTRLKIEVEPLKSATTVSGNGPYTYVSN